MSTEPGRLVRVTGFNDDLFALDETGALWSFEYRRFRRVWTRLPLPTNKISDFYMNFKWNEDDALVTAPTLRVLDDAGKLWELRQFGNEYVWDAISLEAR